MGCSPAFSSSTNNVAPLSKTSFTEGYKANIFKVPPDSSFKDIEDIPSLPTFL